MVAFSWSSHLRTATFKQPHIKFALIETSCLTETSFLTEASCLTETICLTEASCLQAVHVSLEPVEAGGEVKLNLAALQQHEEPSSSLPAVRTSITSVTSVSPRRRSTAHSPMPSPVPSEIQPLSESHQVGACLHMIAMQTCKTWHSVFCCKITLHSDTG